MTVAKIKEYVDACIEHLRNIDYFEHIRMFIGTLEKINSMLDKLDDRPKAKWKHDGSQWENRFICSKCGHKIFEEQQPYCSNCGARMNDRE